MRHCLVSLPLIISLLASALIGCSRPPPLVGIDNPEVPAESLADVSRHKLFILTTREESELTGVFYSSERAPELGTASVDVTIPPNHVVGSLERPKRLPPDPRTEFAVVDPVVYRDDASFASEVNLELARRPPGKRSILLFVHGYNNSTSDAILRLAQFVKDTQFQGVPVLLTWASANRTSRYVYDLNSALIARGKLKEAADMLSSTRAESIDIFAHSMGAFLTMEGLVEAQQTGRLGKGKQIDNIMLASPDIDMDLFREQISQLSPAIVSKIYVLISGDDAALRISRRLAGGIPRVGAANAVELEDLGVVVIDLSKIEDSSSGSHTKFAGSPEVVKLIGAGLNSAGTFGENNATSLDSLLAGVPIRIFGR